MYNFKKIGDNVHISIKASIHNAENIEIGNNVRIDDFCTLSAGVGGIKIGDNVHISTQSCLIGKELIQIGNFCNVSIGCIILSSSDDFSGNYLISPMVDKKYTNVNNSPVILKDGVIIGARSTILPGVTFEKCSGSGAMSLVKNNVDEFSIVGGIPAKHLFYRSKKMLKMIDEIK